MKAQGLRQQAIRRFRHDLIGLSALGCVLVFLVIAILVTLQVIGSGWDELAADGRLSPSATYWFGTNINGQDVFKRALASTKTAFIVGLVVTGCSTMLGGITGAFSGYWQESFMDRFFSWLASVLDAIPFYLFVAAVAFALQGKPYAMHIAMISTFWTATFRFIRGETMKIKNQDFIAAAITSGSSPLVIIFHHVLPNVSPILLVQGTITFVSAIKSEAILSFLGLGIKDDISWGLMLAESTTEVASGILNNFFAASGFMFVLVLSFSILADSLQDALDPRYQGVS